MHIISLIKTLIGLISMFWGQILMQLYMYGGLLGKKRDNISVKDDFLANNFVQGMQVKYLIQIMSIVDNIIEE